jgi:hypothetical protein
MKDVILIESFNARVVKEATRIDFHEKSINDFDVKTHNVRGDQSRVLVDYTTTELPIVRLDEECGISTNEPVYLCFSPEIDKLFITPINKIIQENKELGERYQALINDLHYEIASRQEYMKYCTEISWMNIVEKIKFCFMFLTKKRGFHVSNITKKVLKKRKEKHV